MFYVVASLLNFNSAFRPFVVIVTSTVLIYWNPSTVQLIMSQIWASRLSGSHSLYFLVIVACWAKQSPHFWLNVCLWCLCMCFDLLVLVLHFQLATRFHDSVSVVCVALSFSPPALALLHEWNRRLESGYRILTTFCLLVICLCIGVLVNSMER
jgi:hypothetical protein